MLRKFVLDYFRFSQTHGLEYGACAVGKLYFYV